MKRAYQALAAFLLLGAAAARAGDAEFAADFRADALPAGWWQTPKVQATPSSSGLQMEATGWDAKVYRTGVALPPGRYVLYGRGQGNLKLLITGEPEGAVLTHLVLSGEKPLTDYVDFTIGPDDPRALDVVAWVDGPGTKANLEWLRIEAAPPLEGDTPAPPSPEALAKERPDPPVVRGFMISPVGQVKRQDFLDAAAWGANVVRLQVRPLWLAQQIGKPLWDAWPAILDQVDQAVADAGAAGLKVVVVLMDPPVPGVQFDGAALWQSPELESDFTKFWTELAVRLKPRAKTVWAYDIYNEPLDRAQLPWTPKQWHPLALKLLRAIRAVDPGVWLVYESGPGGMSRGFEGLVPLPDTHVVYGFHDYSPGKFAMQGVGYTGDLNQKTFDPAVGVPYPLTINGTLWDKDQLRREMEPVVEFQRKWQVPVYVGEFSVVRWAPQNDAVRWLQDMIGIFESLGWSWSYHAFREWNGWSLEHDGTYWTEGMPAPQRVDSVTERGKVLRKAFEKNREAASVPAASPAPK